MTTAFDWTGPRRSPRPCTPGPNPNPGSCCDPAPPNGSIQFDDAGKLGAMTWLYDKVTGFVTAGASDALLLQNNAGTSAFYVFDSGVDDLGDFIIFGSNLNGDAPKTWTTTYTEARIRIIGELTSDPDAAYELFGPGTWPGGTISGFAVTPNFVVSPAGAEQQNNLWAGGKGIQRFKPALPQPNPATPPDDGFLEFSNPRDQPRYMLPSGAIGQIGQQFQLFTFPADANQVLTDAQSDASLLLVLPGPITVTRSLTSPLPPATTRFVVVKNDTGVDLEWFWSSGGGVLLPPSATSIVTADGTNAVLMGSFASGAPTVATISPTFGDTAGFTSVTITGTGFTGATGATVGGVALTSFLVVSDTTITGVTGAHAPATGQSVVVFTPSGNSLPNALYQYFNPTSIPNLSIWQRADLGVTLVGTNVSDWADQSGNGIDLSQAAAPNQPFWFAAPAGFNGRPALGTNGVDAVLQLKNALMSITQPSWAFYVFRLPAVPSNPVFFGIGSGGSNANAHDVNIDGALTLKASDSATLVGPVLATGTTYVVAVKFDTATSAIYVNHWSTTAATGALAGDTALSRAVGSFAATQFLLAEGFEYERNLLPAEVEQIVQYLGARYNVPVSA